MDVGRKVADEGGAGNVHAAVTAGAVDRVPPVLVDPAVPDLGDAVFQPYPRLPVVEDVTSGNQRPAEVLHRDSVARAAAKDLALEEDQPGVLLNENAQRVP